MDRMTSTVRVFARAKPEDKLEIWVDGFDLNSRWWFQIFLFSSLFGEDSQFDYFFQRGWNHQLDLIWGIWIDWMMKYFFSFLDIWECLSFSMTVETQISKRIWSQPMLKFKSRLKPISWSLKKNGSTQQPTEKQDFNIPKDHWTLKTGYFEDPNPAIQVQTLPLEGPRSLGMFKRNETSFLGLPNLPRCLIISDPWMVIQIPKLRM